MGEAGNVAKSGIPAYIRRAKMQSGKRGEQETESHATYRKTKSEYETIVFESELRGAK